MNGITIKLARESDSATVSAILQEAAMWLADRGMPLWRAGELEGDKIREEVAGGLFWLADVNGEVAGCVRFQTEDRLFWPDVPPDESAFIHRLAVRRRFAGGAVASALINWSKDRAAGLGKRYLRLDCQARTRELHRVYEKRGFRKHDERQVGPYLVVRYEYELSEAGEGANGIVASPAEPEK